MRGSAVFRTGVAPGGALAGPWVKNELWTRARAVPSLDLRFADNKSLVDAVTGASLVTFTRASNGTFVGSDGVLQTAATDVPRFDHNPTTGESLGLLVEEQRSNLLLNSGTLSTQSVTVTAAAHTLSFTGTGTITLTGASTAGPLVGSGTGESNRVSLTFTPTAGSLTLTVSGTVTNAQLEVGAFRTSYISTAGAAATRSADVASISGSNFSPWYRQDEGTVFADATKNSSSTSGFPRIAQISDSTNNNAITILWAESISRLYGAINTGGATQADIGNNSVTQIAPHKTALAAKINDFAISNDGLNAVTDASGSMPLVDRLFIGKDAGSSSLNGTIRRLAYWGQRLPNNVLQAITQ